MRNAFVFDGMHGVKITSVAIFIIGARRNSFLGGVFVLAILPTGRQFNMLHYHCLK